MLAGTTENDYEYVEKQHIRQKCIEKRPYQLNLANEAMSENSIVVLPTGLGKTAIALLVIADYLSRSGDTILFLAPTRVLVHQHHAFLQNTLTVDGHFIGDWFRRCRDAQGIVEQ